MSAVNGNMRVGDLNHFQMYHEGPLQMNSMVNSGTSTTILVQVLTSCLCDSYLPTSSLRFVFRLRSLRGHKILELNKLCSGWGQMRRDLDPPEEEDQFHPAADRGAGKGLLGY